MTHEALPDAVRLEGAGKRALEVGRTRLVIGATLFALGFLGLGLRLVEVSVLGGGDDAGRSGGSAAAGAQRADIVDRNGVVLATNVESHALYADARLVRDAPALARRLAEILPDLDPEQAARGLASGRSFVWIRRQLSPRQVYAVNRLGEPGLRFLPAQRRVYPLGPLVSHVLGYVDVDNRGLGGIERRFDRELQADPAAPLALSLDIRFQHVLRAELAAALAEFKAIGAAGVILDIASGEVLAMVSLPDFDPNRPATDAGGDDARFNRAALGRYEMGSTFKTFTAAMALDSGTVALTDGFDASQPLHIARFTIRDFHPEGRWLSVPEIFMYSSNIGAARMALAVGAERQRDYLGRFGLLAPSPIELPEVGEPITPDVWREVTTATIGFGHGIAISPLQMATAVASLVNGGTAVTPTVLLRRGAPAAGAQVVSPRTSHQMRQLLRLAVKLGTGKRAEVEGYLVGGKTGTAEKSGKRGYDRRRLISSFVGAFPIDRPRYVVFAVLDEPKGTERTLGYATGGWTAAPLVARVVARIAALAGIAPRSAPLPGEDGDDGKPLLVTPDGTEIRLASF